MRINGRKIREVLDWLVGWLVVSLRDILICIQPVINGYDGMTFYLSKPIRFI
jgi:hypothetical protein